MKSGKAILGVLAGLAAGTILGILLAPDKGTNTRKKISKKGEAYLDNLKSKFEDFLVTATNDLEYAKSETENLVDKGKEKVQEVKDEIKNMAGEKRSSQS
ncbi:MAG: YtxH domain-containing protein [Bacteroidota bacterium]